MGAGKVSGQPGDMPRGLCVCEARSLSPQSVGARSPNDDKPSSLLGDINFARAFESTF